jgi:hypothetical protein
MEQTPPRSNAGIALLAALLIAGSAAGVMFWQLSQKEAPVAPGFGLDAVAPRESLPAAALVAPQSGLDMLDARPGLATQASSRPSPVLSGGGERQPFRDGGTGAAAFTAAVRRSEARARELSIQYTARHPVIAQYGRDWMSRPGLKKLNDDYMADHDPVKFLRGLAGSSEFRELGAQYAADPAVRAFVKDVLKEAPKELLSASADLLVEDGLMRVLLSDAGKALGLPQEFTDGLKDYGKKPVQPAR